MVPQFAIPSKAIDGESWRDWRQKPMKHILIAPMQRRVTIVPFLLGVDEQSVPIGDLIDTVLCRVIDPHTMALVAQLRQQMLEHLRDAGPNEAAEIRETYQHKLQAMLDGNGRHTCPDS